MQIQPHPLQFPSLREGRFWVNGNPAWTADLFAENCHSLERGAEEGTPKDRISGQAPVDQQGVQPILFIWRESLDNGIGDLLDILTVHLVFAFGLGCACPGSARHSCTHELACILPVLAPGNVNLIQQGQLAQNEVGLSC